MNTYKVDMKNEPAPRIVMDWGNTLNHSKHRKARVKRAKAKKNRKK